MEDKCFSIHGHRYGITLYFQAVRDSGNPDISIPFSDFERVGRYFNEKWDHAHIIDKDDPLLPLFQQVEETNFPIPMKRVVLDEIPSVENICFTIFDDLAADWPLITLEIQETDSSTVCYSAHDYEEDLVRINRVPHECDFSDPLKVKCDECGKTRFLYRSELRKRTTPGT
jgi:6-pyruvoyl-tetrahydropterin synthase